MSLLFSSARSVEEAREVSSPFTRPSSATLASVFDDRLITNGRYWVAQLKGPTSALAVRLWLCNIQFWRKNILTPGRIFFRAVGESKTWDDRPYMYFINSFFWKVFSHIKTAPLFVTWNPARLGNHLLCQPCWVWDYVQFCFVLGDCMLFCWRQQYLINDAITSNDNLCYSCRVVTASEHCNVYALNNPHAENDHINVLLVQLKSFVK